MMFKVLIISLLLVIVDIEGTVSTLMTSVSMAVQEDDPKFQHKPNPSMSPNPKTNLSPRTKHNPMRSLNTGKSPDIKNTKMTQSSKMTLSSKMTPDPKTNRASAMTPKTVIPQKTSDVTNGSTILDAMFNIHFLSYVGFLLFCVYLG